MNEQLLKQLCEIPAVPGREDRMISFMRGEFKDTASINEVEVDKLGNVIAKLDTGSEGKERPRVVVFAHMDEVGLMINRIDENGFLRVEKVGSPNRKTLVGQRVLVETDEGTVPGVIGVSSYHFQEVENRYEVPHIHDLYIDVGASSRAEVQDQGIKVGSTVTYQPNYQTLGDKLISSKTLDNRLGCYLLLQLAKSLQPTKTAAEVYLVASVQEEFNVQGITPALEQINPDVGFCIESYIACDTPELEDELDTELGEGPVITLLDFHGRGTLAGLVPNPKLIDYLQNQARRDNIPVQKAARKGILTETSYGQYRGDGIIMGTISVPARYLHAPIETVNKEDIESTSELLTGSVKNFNGETLRGLERG